MDNYYLNRRQLSGISFQTVTTASGHNAHIYWEQDVERAAWRVYGGPDGLKQMLRRKKAKHDSAQSSKQPSEHKPVPAPEWFLLPWERWVRTEDLFALRQQVPEASSWLWEAVNVCLDSEESARRARVSELFVLAPWTARKGIVRDAVQGYIPRYPARLPPLPRPASRSVAALRQVLGAAPSAHNDVDDGIETITNEAGDVIAYCWDEAYLDRLFAMLVAVIQAHGTGAEGWESIRWEVYDKYTECITGLRYVEGVSGPWVDDARQWLVGNLPKGRKYPSTWYDRTLKPLCDTYDSLVPHTDAYGCLIVE
ncbi:hypothetical protein EXIGLDRAFT_719943 [Exidia glandulosa HHB12029]|uniref:Uncharacterized protein n=1 Tax=Exidia glandulosa HHB12029 TaxID=1314781 RepID=A0A165GPJ8_EXIGL|nr:hypothetical protein EXIGLDRAFT_719943 [Exidia glandulosa HHB12029]